MAESRIDALKKAVHSFCRVVYIISGAGCMVALVILIVMDVSLRFLFNRPIASSFELVMFMMVFVVFTALSYSETQNGHVQIELLFLLLPKRFQKVIKAVNSIIIAGLFILIAQQNVIRARGLRTEGLRSAILHVPVYPFYLMVAFGCALLSLVILVDVLNSFIPTKEE